ncbi:hypothetical protein [uncultured Sutterella sp.]|uniref:hypothetical protein n=1 Tax=uncultured Sutterella sp. TaxID=286133 RepID=UPI0025D23699|nr:hypothetical protein [uncultured Sutterella sp.]
MSAMIAPGLCMNARTASPKPSVCPKASPAAERGKSACICLDHAVFFAAASISCAPVFVCDSEESVRYVFRHIAAVIAKKSFDPKKKEQDLEAKA